MSNKDLPIYIKVATTLQKKIISGTLKAGERLPTEYELANKFNVSRLTIRKAIDYLIVRNILIKQKNHGTYVVSQNKIQSGATGLSSFSEIIHSLGMTPSTNLIEINEIHLPNQEVMSRLNLSSKESVFFIKRVRCADGDPLIIENLYVPKKHLGDVSTINFEHDSIFETIEKQTLIGYSQQEISAEIVTQNTADLLHINPQSPILAVDTTTYSIQGMPLLIDLSYYRSDKYTFKNILKRNH